jgi:fructose-1,6-bisphosphatase/inositol monophosphatase family enzyme
MVPDAQKVIEILRKAAAEEIMPRFRNLTEHDIREKSPGNLVTTVDLAMEKRLAQSLKALAPESRIIGEESAHLDPGVLHDFSGEAPVWVIDPLDGTLNFTRSKPCFAVILAYCLNGRTLAGWIHDPISGTTAWAVDGKGAFIDEQPIKTAMIRPNITDMNASIGYTARKNLARLRKEGRAFDAPASVRYGSVGREYMDLASGKIHFAHYSRRLKPWDHAAGVLIHQEAGGFSALAPDRTPYQPSLGETTKKTALILTPDADSWELMYAIIKKAESS